MIIRNGAASPRDERILVVASHADDEILGAGATLVAAGRSGVAVHVLVMSVASQSREVDEGARSKLKEGRIVAARAAAALGGWELSLLDFPDNGFGTVPRLDLVKAIEKPVADFQPTTVLTHYPGDLSLDHQITSLATRTAIRPTGRKAPANLVFFEIQSSTEWCEQTISGGFCPTLWVPVDPKCWDLKMRALGGYADELRQWPHPRSLEGVTVLARYRGSQIGADLAEAFILARGIASYSEQRLCWR